MTRKALLAGNWKMFKNSAEARAFFTELIKLISPFKSDRDIVFAVPFTSLEASVEATRGTPIIIAAQNIYFEKEGAFTGEISASMVCASGAKAVVIGHSERRQFFGDSGLWVNKKVRAAIENKLMPILCIGESLTEREAGNAFTVLETQLQEALDGFNSGELADLVVAYEPVWAIGTGKTATPEMAQEVHCFVRKYLSSRFDSTLAAKTRILYGGSVKPDNIAKLMSQEDIDGALVGGASLEAASFAKIINYDA